MTAQDDLHVYVTERDDALRSLDESKIRAFSEKWRVPAPIDHEAFWAGVHKARMQIALMPDAEKAISRAWLEDHGYTVPRCLGS